MLAWITTTEQKYTPKLVDIISQQTIILRNKYVGFTQITLKDGSVINPYTIRWVNQQAPIIPSIITCEK